MLKSYREDLPIFQFHGLQKFSHEVEHAVLSRQGGASENPFDTLNVSFTVDDREDHVFKNRSTICKAFGFEENKLISAHQIHSKYVYVVDGKALHSHEKHHDVEDSDALVTSLKNVALMVKVADCQAILMFDPVQKVVAAVHAGWKGLAQNVSAATLLVMKKQFGVKPENVMVGISPSLGPCCAFFSNPEIELPKTFAPFIHEDKTVDLWEFSLKQLQQAGIQQKNIELARVCTMCGGGEKFYSFRRDRGVTGRFGALIALKS